MEKSTTANFHITGCVLAGGGSRRFGSDKLAQQLDGRSLLERAVLALTSVAEEIWVLGQMGNVRETKGGIRVIPDSVPGAGPLHALAAALTLAAASRPPEPPRRWLFLLAADMPLVTPAFLSGLAQVAASSHGTAVVPWADDRLQPACALYSVTLAAGASSAVESGERSLSRWVKALDDAHIVSDSEWRAWAGPEVFVNVNLPEDLVRAQAHLSARSEPRIRSGPE